MKVLKTNSTRTRTSSEIDLELPKNLSSETKDQIKRDVGEYLVEQINVHLSESSTPVSGAGFKKSLSPAYKKFKVDSGASGVADLELTGALKDAISFKTSNKGIELGVFGGEAPKADGHNNFSGESELPQRRFLPGDGQNFRPALREEVDKIIQDAIAENEVDISRRELSQIKSEEDLRDFIKDKFPLFSFAEASETITRSPALARLLNEFNLLRFLDIG